jgi:hypothetical protein
VPRPPQPRLNLGERLLRALFATWREARAPAHDAPDGAGEPMPLLRGAELSRLRVRITDGAEVVLRCAASELARAPGDSVPHWVAQARGATGAGQPLLQ